MIQITRQDRLVAAREYRQCHLPIGARAVMTGALDAIQVLQMTAWRRRKREADAEAVFGAMMREFLADTGA